MGVLKGITTKEIIGRFYMALEQDLGTNWITKLGAKVPSNQETESYGWLGHVPQMREKVGGKQAQELRASDYTLTNKEYEATIPIDVADRRRDKTGQIEIRINELARRANAHWNKLVSTLVKNGDGAGYECYDGQYFFDTDHSEGDSGTQVNAVTNSHVSQLDVSTAASPTPDEMSKAILGIITYMMGYKDDRGEYINENASEFLVMCPATQIYSSALQAVRDKRLDTGSGTRDNLVVTGDFNVDVVINPRLDYTTEFVVFRTDASAKPFILQEEVPLTMSALAEGSEEEFHNGRHLFSVEATRAAGFGFWQYACKGTLS